MTRLIQVKRIADVPLGSTRVRRDDDGVLPIRHFLLDIRHHARLAEQVVHRNIKESLDLAGVEVHGDDVVSAGDSEEVGDQSVKGGGMFSACTRRHPL